MTALMLIGYIDGGAPPSPADAPLHHRISASGGVALCMDVDPDDAAQEARVLVWAERQNAILCAYARASDVVPVSLGAVFTTAQAVTDHVGRDRSLPDRALALRGLCEFSLHVGIAAPVASDRDGEETLSGSAFLIRRRRERDARRSIATERSAFVARLSAAADVYARETKLLPRNQHDRLLDTAILIERSDIGLFTDRLAQAAEGARGLSLDCRLIGPGPVFSFLRAIQEEAAEHA